MLENQKRLDQVVIFVNPSMSVQSRFELALSYGYKIFSIITSANVDKIDYQLVKARSDYYYVGTDKVEIDYRDIIQIIKHCHLEICAVINGVDSSLYYNDYLAQRLLPNTVIDLNFSKLRLNKFQVNEVLAENGIVTIPSLEVITPHLSQGQLHKISTWGWPIVGKPSENTASMAGFKILHNLEQLEEYLLHTMGHQNSYYSNFVIDKIILQKYISLHDYDEFIIDFLTYEGKHYLQGLAIYDKKISIANEVVYNKYRPFIVEEIPDILPIVEYVKKILEALHVNYGFTHNEVLWNRKTGQFYLVESNNRMAGAGVSDTYLYDYGYTPLHSMFELMKGNAIQNNAPVKRLGYSVCLNMYNFYTDNPSKINLEGIDSFRFLVCFYPHKKVTPEFYAYTRSEHITATCVLSSDSAVKLQYDVDEIQHREQQGTLFQ